MTRWDNIDSIVSHVQSLSGSLNPITQYRHDFFFKDFSGFLQRKFFIGNNFLHYTTEIELCHPISPFFKLSTVYVLISFL